MPDYRRAFQPGGTFFFTLVTEQRAPLLLTSEARSILRHAIESCRKIRPFTLDAIVLLPDHLHAIWTLPAEDADFSIRWAAIKADFTRHWIAAGGNQQRRTGSRLHERRRGVWQRRFWEHHLRDETDFQHHLDYLHYNPVKHGLASCPHAWPYSTFNQWVRQKAYESQWRCICDGQSGKPTPFDNLEAGEGIA